MLYKVCNQIITPAPLTQKQAAKYEKRILPIDTKDFRYLRFRAIGNFEKSGANGNADAFPYMHFEDERPGYGYKSFINKRAHCEHNSRTGIKGSIGDLPDAFLNRFNYSDDVKEKRWASLSNKSKDDLRKRILEAKDQTLGDIEVLMRIDTQLVKSASHDSKTKQLLDRIIRMIDTGQQITCSMGCNVSYSACSVCPTTAKYSADYCSHLKPGNKGKLSSVPANQIRDMLDSEHLRPEWLPHIISSQRDLHEVLNGQSNRYVIARNLEINHELSFFELSVVASPAFKDAIVLEKYARKQDEGRDEYLRRLYKELGRDNVLDMYDLLIREGDISSACSLQ